MIPGPEVCRLTPEDLPLILELERLTSPDPWSLESFLGEMERSFTVPLGIMAAGSLAGFLLAWLLPPETHLLKLAVSPPWEGRGLGTRLLSFLIELTRQAGGSRILLEVRHTNQRALRLYRRAGFAIDGRAIGYYGQGIDALRMSLDLRDPAAGI
ncbi:MAG: GNAT family N-acetyltransferase [Deltaproteobacteria bacterium]|nr:GNAT family N-acetyltransferase [Deltaproteobacteria bacterium]